MNQNELSFWRSACVKVFLELEQRIPPGEGYNEQRDGNMLYAGKLADQVVETLRRVRTQNPTFGTAEHQTNEQLQSTHRA